MPDPGGCLSGLPFGEGYGVFRDLKLRGAAKIRKASLRFVKRLPVTALGSSPGGRASCEASSGPGPLTARAGQALKELRSRGARKKVPRGPALRPYLSRLAVNVKSKPFHGPSERVPVSPRTRTREPNALKLMDTRGYCPWNPGTVGGGGSRAWMDSGKS